MVGMNDPVRHPETGEITTLSELDSRGEIEFKKVSNWTKNGNAAYFADIQGTSTGWRIRKTAYLSRTNQKEELQRQFN